MGKQHFGHAHNRAQAPAAPEVMIDGPSVYYEGQPDAARTVELKKPSPAPRAPGKPNYELEHVLCTGCSSRIVLPSADDPGLCAGCGELAKAAAQTPEEDLGICKSCGSDLLPAHAQAGLSVCSWCIMLAKVVQKRSPSRPRYSNPCSLASPASTAGPDET